MGECSLDEHGQINTPGFAKEMILEYKREDIKASKLRIKEWDYYIVMNDDFEMAFTPILDRKDKTSLIIIMSDQHQVFGHFSGQATLDDGTVIKVKDFLGFAEVVRNKW